MSREEKELVELIEARIQERIDKLERSVRGFFWGGIGSMFLCVFYLGIMYNEHKEVTETIPIIRQHTTQIAVINNKLHIP